MDSSCWHSAAAARHPTAARQQIKLHTDTAEPIITEKQQQHDRDLIAESLPQQAEHPQSPPQPIGGSCWWKKPVYYSPVVSPLERGPDFRFLDGRRPQITTVWELERRKKHVQLGKQIVMLLSELREAEELYEESKMRKTLQQEKIEQHTPKAKGNEEPF